MGVTTDLDISLQPKQADLLDILEATGPDVPIRIGWGGARGAAKSGGLRRIAMILATTCPGIVIVIIRRHYGDLMENHVEKMRLEYAEFHAKYFRQGDGEWRLDNGSRITLAYGDTPKDIQEFSRGPEYTFLFVDQAEQFTEQELTWLTIPNRWPAAAQRFAKSVFFFNPGGPGTEFLRRVFYKREFRKDENPGDWAFIQAYGWDNYEWFRGEVPISAKEFYALPSDERFELFIKSTSYGRSMNALPPALRVGELLGSFEHFSGQYYAGVWDENTCLLPVGAADAIIQPWWTRWTATDWGFAHHSCHLWFAAGKLSPAQAGDLGIATEWPIDVAIVYRELVVSDTGEEDLARMIVEKTPTAERNMIRAHWLGPDAWSKRGTANTVAAQLEGVLSQNHLPAPQRADNDRIGGWRLLYGGFQRARWRAGEQVTQEMAKSGPVLMISAACPQVISAIPLLIRDEDKLEDVLKTSTVGDDVADCLRYGYKSQLDGKSKPPRDVRAQMAFAAAPTPTMKHVAMLRFQEQERKRSVVYRQPRFR